MSKIALYVNAVIIKKVLLSVVNFVISASLHVFVVESCPVFDAVQILVVVVVVVDL